MTDRKISELVAVTSVDDADEFVLARSGSSNKISGASLKAAGGGSLPSEWTAVTENNNVLRYEVGGTSGTLQLQLGADANTGVVFGVADEGGGVVDAVIQTKSIGGGNSQISATTNPAPGQAATAVLDGRGGLSLFTAAGYKGIDAWDDEGNVQRFGLLPTAGQVMIGVVTAPPDSDLAASQLAFWFDDTDGAAKLMLKGKSANGTVVTGQVALS